MPRSSSNTQAQQATPESNGTARVPQPLALEPPKLEGRGKQAIHTPEVIKTIAEGAAKGWFSNGLTYKTKHGAQGALQSVKEAIVAAEYAKETGDLTGRVWESEPGVFVFALAAKTAVR